MLHFKTTIQQYGSQAEKTGWFYISIPVEVTNKLKPGCRKSFRIMGKLDNHEIEKTALLPAGDGSYILPLNSVIRKAIRKGKDAIIDVYLESDDSIIIMNKDLMLCLEDEPGALNFFKSLPGSHQRYFSKWIESAKTGATLTKRIAMTINAMLQKQNYAEMMRTVRETKRL
jgi:hypothetical protein